MQITLSKNETILFIIQQCVEAGEMQPEEVAGMYGELLKEPLADLLKLALGACVLEKKEGNIFYPYTPIAELN